MATEKPVNSSSCSQWRNNSCPSAPPGRVMLGSENTLAPGKGGAAQRSRGKRRDRPMRRRGKSKWISSRLFAEDQGDGSLKIAGTEAFERTPFSGGKLTFKVPVKISSLRTPLKASFCTPEDRVNESLSPFSLPLRIPGEPLSFPNPLTMVPVPVTFPFASTLGDQVITSERFSALANKVTGASRRAAFPFGPAYLAFAFPLFTSPVTWSLTLSWVPLMDS